MTEMTCLIAFDCLSLAFLSEVPLYPSLPLLM